MLKLAKFQAFKIEMKRSFTGGKFYSKNEETGSTNDVCYDQGDGSHECDTPTKNDPIIRY